MAHRRYEAGELVSTAWPALRLRVHPSLAHVGQSSFVIKNLALAERHYFVEAVGRRVRRMLVVQFEGFLRSNDDTYRFSLPDPVELGGVTFGSWVFGFSLARSDAPELANTVDVLSEHGLLLDDEQVVARYGRIVGDEARHELLLFYHENTRDLGHSLDELCDDGTVRPELAGVAQGLQLRALQSFELVDYTDSA